MTSQTRPAALFDLGGKITVVTGASRGIGESIARTLAAAGAEVIVSSRKLADCEKVAAAIRDGGGKAEAWACHIGELAQIDALFAHVEQRYGRLDILVNNAATNPHYGPIWETDVGAFQKTVDVNIRGYWFMSSGGVKLMQKNGGGVIVNTASINGVVPGPLQGIYSVTKSAVIAMTRAFARECAPLNIRVNALLPGLTDTKFAATLIQQGEANAGFMSHIPMGRHASPDEMAGTVLYLVSPAASYTTGACINVDGGYLTA
ncbi:MAG: family oxidoreductase [Hydrocarboniphaga sp.]|uniref:SDR family oxidoreductase n=1 Tax=Hydrocarboniphaga sp. TaxID=2033016 RepID=UPI0026388BA1|nr:SDR family oxidoreductase [Hydrocarboniphaga sp.]MDB5970535.1 family oxidoreductase [Hydrocarboniphaga sp.]